MSVRSFGFIWISMLWVYDHYKSFNSFSAGINFRSLQSKDRPRAERVNNIEHVRGRRHNSANTRRPVLVWRCASVKTTLVLCLLGFSCNVVYWRVECFWVPWLLIIIWTRILTPPSIYSLPARRICVIMARSLFKWRKCRACTIPLNITISLHPCK